MRTQVYTYSNIETRVTYHPAALLRNPRLKGAAWEDFQMIRDRHLELSGLPPFGQTGAAG
jgi:DNA polymerase